MGQSKLNEFKKVEDAVKDFEKKFKDKTKNNWSDRENFTPHPGKYTLIEVDGEEDAEVKVTARLHETEHWGAQNSKDHQRGMHIIGSFMI